MTDREIDRIIREHEYMLPVSVYIAICRSRQVLEINCNTRLIAPAQRPAGRR